MTCQTCKFWDGKELHNGGRGWCRRNVPAFCVTPFPRNEAFDHDKPLRSGQVYPWRYTGWPETRPEDWCGQHEERVGS